MRDSILVVNAGSSSIKFKLYRIEGADLALSLSGGMSGIGGTPALRVTDGSGALLEDRRFEADAVPDASAAQHHLADWLVHHLDDTTIVAVGHRVVHGGAAFAEPVLIDDAVLRRLETFIPLAPLHQLGNLDPIRVLRQRRPDLPQVACFDTAFHRGHPELSDRFALPRFLHDEGVRRYGFHGLSYEYVAGRLKEVAPETAEGRVVIAHLGSGASLCALKQGRSQETTMSFTALDGVPMGTRCGALDPGVVLHLIEHRGMTPAEVGHMLYYESGLLGLSGLSNDVRTLLASDRPEAELAVAFFCRRVAQAAAALAVTLGGLDAFVFTAGIGENAPEIRQRVIADLSWAGLILSNDANGSGVARLDASGSRAQIWVIPTDEERMIAKHTMRLLDRIAPGARA
ncbi:acetate/propionate family kinase [Methylobacterium sp. AMS5]|uniref:acetate/propionate family kinase n=1 Tax=Methylobacterium sp. AMS5 TaxID=925818 RepID=UPI00074F8743|nr:acetate/propionate family kinase [Methylobacterium sp. AMS5]AMB43622.1 acetate kinase [Methylobacterium sp. AMS5]